MRYANLFLQEEAVRFQAAIALVEENGCSFPVETLPTPGWCSDGCGNYFRDSSPEAQRLTHRCPADCSVGIHFNRRLTKSETEMFKRRAYRLSAGYDNRSGQLATFTVTGFQLRNNATQKCATL
jgi:hypothetical protein